MSCALSMGPGAIPCVEVACDAEGCPAALRVEHASTFGFARLAAAGERWRHVLLKRRHGGPAHSIDLCRKHRELEVESMPLPASPLWLAKRRAVS